MKKFIGNVAFLAAFVIIFAKFMTVLFSTPFPMSIVVSSSMEPVLYKGDIVPWVPCGIGDVKKGDIVVYRSKAMWNGENYIVHRVNEIIEKNGKRMLITKGDANNYTDQAGPHVPEAPVDDEMLQGKLIMFGNVPARIPYLGYIWLFISHLSKQMTSHISWQSSQSGEHFVIFTPFIFSLSAFLLAAVLWLPNGKSMKERLHELIFGEERMGIKKIFALLLLIYLPFLFLTSFFAFDFVYVDENSVHSIPVFNPSMIDVRAVAFFDGNGSIELTRKIVDISSGSGEVINISYMNGDGKVFVYSSPLWRVVPMNSMMYFYNVSPKLCIIYSSFVSALILSFMTLLALVFFNLLIDGYKIASAYSTFLFMGTFARRRYRSIVHYIISFVKRVKIKEYFLSWNDFMDRKAVYVSFLSIPFAYFMFDGVANLFMVVILASLALSAVSYAAGIRFKNEVAFISFFSSIFYSSIFVARTMFYVRYHIVSTLIQFIAITMLLSLLLFISMFIMMLTFIFVIRAVMERIEPSLLLEVGDI